jgi:dTDP-4-dehydrorhamnose 3,5-epimerase
MSIQVQSLDIPEIKLIRSIRHFDERGFFSETYNKRDFAEAQIDLEFVQDNFSYSIREGTVRGLHFQTPPFAQDKLLRVIKGRIFDVAVDIRRSSPTFGKHVAVELSADEWNQILIPIGFAHGFCTLEPETAVTYKTTNYYSPAHDFGIRWNDPDLGIAWPYHSEQIQTSQKDGRHPFLKDSSVLF